MAACLFAGLYTDTGGFKYAETTSKTLAIAKLCFKIYPKFSKLIFDIENSDSPDRLKFISLMLGSIKTFVQNHVAIASLSYDEIISNNLSNAIGGYSEIAKYAQIRC